ncbi:ATP-binding protein [Streptomyces sp. G-G2]|uniref:ATP-binding protein n=1 Tax=Streptomyces sp. G-G2 TaxID=3046201 RepID=UPI0032D958D8
MPGTVTRCRDFTRRALTDWSWLREPGAPGSHDDFAAPGAYGALAVPRAFTVSETFAVSAVSEVEEAAEDVLLMVSEMVTNACMHAGGPGELVLRNAPDRLRVEVSDGSPERPRRRSPGRPGLPGGHGLVVLERLSRSWGWERHEPPGGKTVWVEVASPFAPPGTARRR